MADKERIRVEIIHICKRPKNKDQYKCDCVGSPNEMAGLQVCPIHPQVVAKKGISKQEAIEIMAEAMYYGTYDRKEFPVAFTEQYKGTQIYWKKTAELALNALLEGVKK